MNPGPTGRSPGARRRRRALGLLVLLAALTVTGGCASPQLNLLRSGLDSLRTVVDTMKTRDSVAYLALGDLKRQLADQRELLLSTRASSGTTSQQVSDEMSRLEGKLDEVMGRFQQLTQRMPPPQSAPAQSQGDPNQLYDEANQDLTQGRYALALQGFRDFVRRYPKGELTDNAQYGIGECFFAQSRFDSAAVEYAKVESGWPEGDRVPASLYKLGLSREKLGLPDGAKKTFEDLVRRFPNSGEAQLARERLGGTRRR